ncbi:Gldg family protein [Tundrisphaera sp. TA3]|uniref:Gldg family protein n=1 Tax=Tundrisphaera sp. TA3 TaxID=3435775 RepID=UPI003EB7637A
MSSRNNRNRSNQNKNNQNQPKAAPKPPAPASAKPPAPVDVPLPPAPPASAATAPAGPARPASQPIPPRRSSGWPLRPHVIGAIFGRNFLSYFSNPAGYVFITLFVLVGAWAAFWRPEFFANNLANLGTLNEWMPYLLLFFIPAITMSAWAEERRQGTDELLLTLPAHDIEVVLGKYLAALGIYTVALMFSLTHVAVLAWLGSPDLGIMASTFLGYWLMGAMMIAIGLVASLLSSNVTVGFILGALFCAIPVFAGLVGLPFGPSVRTGIEDLSIPSQFRDFGEGKIPASGLFYFLSMAAAMLFLNMILLGRRHWAGGERSKGLWAHSLIRVVAVVAALVGVNTIVKATGLHHDNSLEKLFTLSDESRKLIKEIPADRPVYIQAYISPEVPRDYIQAKNTLVGLLREYASEGGSRIHLNIVEAEPYSEAARDAQKRFGIEPRPVFSAEEARQSRSEIFLGVAFTSGLEEVVVPFFDPGLPIEYELTRSIRVVSKSGRKKIGILATDAKMLGGFDFRSMGQDQEWPFVTELKKQYEVSSVAVDAPLPNDIDVMLVAQPSSLNQKQIEDLTAYVKAGHPTLLFLDPLPMFNAQLAPEVPKQPPGGPFGGGQPPEPKGDLKPLLDALGIDWPTTEIVWNPYNPLANIPELPPEYVFVGKGSGGDDAFNPNQSATSGLQEVVLMFAGTLRPKGSSPEFTPLLTVGDLGGTISFGETVQQSFMGVGGFNPNRRHIPSGMGYTLAARVDGKPATAAPADPAKKDADAKVPDVHAIAIADLDLINEQFFEIRRRSNENPQLNFDNISFVLNCVDVLAGDEAFVGLRKRRPKHRTLSWLEQQSRAFIVEAQQASKQAEEEARKELDEAQAKLDEAVAKVRDEKDIDERTKEIRLANLQAAENRRLDVKKAAIEDQKRVRIQDGKTAMETSIRKIQNRVRTAAIVIAPLPALILALFVFFVRAGRENRGAKPSRLA